MIGKFGNSEKASSLLSLSLSLSPFLFLRGGARRERPRLNPRLASVLSSKFEFQPFTRNVAVRSDSLSYSAQQISHVSQVNMREKRDSYLNKPLLVLKNQEVKKTSSDKCPKPRFLKSCFSRLKFVAIFNQKARDLWATSLI